MYDKDKIVASYAYVMDEVFKDLNNTEQALVLTNCLLGVAKNYLPPELKKDEVNLLSNGKRISFELVKNENNLGLNIAYHAHLIINLLNDKLDLTDE